MFTDMLFDNLQARTLLSNEVELSGLKFSRSCLFPILTIGTILTLLPSSVTLSVFQAFRVLQIVVLQLPLLVSSIHMHKTWLLTGPHIPTKIPLDSPYFLNNIWKQSELEIQQQFLNCVTTQNNYSESLLPSSLSTLQTIFVFKYIYVYQGVFLIIQVASCAHLT